MSLYEITFLYIKCLMQFYIAKSKVFQIYYIHHFITLIFNSTTYNNYTSLFNGTLITFLFTNVP